MSLLLPMSLCYKTESIMTRQTVHEALRDIALITVPVVGACLVWILWPVRGAIKQTSQGSAQILAKVGTALDTVNAPCKDNGHQVVCGTLVQVGQTTKNTGILAAQGAESVMQSRVLIAGAVQNLDKIGDSVTGEVDSLKRLNQPISDAVDAFGGTAKAATTLLGTANTSLATGTDYFQAKKPQFDLMLGHLDDTIADADTALEGLPPIEANAKTITYNFGATTTDFQLKFHAFLFPVPCKTFGCKLRRTWPYVKGTTEIVEPLYWGQQLFENHVP